MTKHEKINYVEFPARNLEATKAFFQDCFGWQFTDYSSEYTAFSGAGLEGGFFKAEMCSSTDKGSALIVLFSENLEQTQEKVEQSGGKVILPIFSFPGGRRFHFTEPSGNELAIWSDS